MLGASIHGIRDDLAKILSAIPGGSMVTEAIDALEAEVRAEAEKGAKKAIPEIRREVRAEVMPYVIASLAAGGIGAVFGLAAIVRARRSSKSLSGADEGKQRARRRQ